MIREINETDDNYSDKEEKIEDEEKSNGNEKSASFKQKLIEKIKKKLMKWKGSGKQKSPELGFIVLPENTRI